MWSRRAAPRPNGADADHRADGAGSAPLGSPTMPDPPLPPPRVWRARPAPSPPPMPHPGQPCHGDDPSAVWASALVRRLPAPAALAAYPSRDAPPRWCDPPWLSRPPGSGSARNPAGRHPREPQGPDAFRRADSVPAPGLQARYRTHPALCLMFVRSPVPPPSLHPPSFGPGAKGYAPTSGRAMTRDTLWPPKPKELDKARRALAGRALLGT